MVEVRKYANQDASSPPEMLIVSEDPSIHGPILDSIKIQGIAIGMVRDGHALLQQLRERQPNLILLDFSLYAMDGIAVCKQIKSSQYSQDIPVVLMFTKDDLDNRAQGFGAGAVDYLIKPLVLEEVTAKVRPHIRQRGIPLQSVPNIEHIGTRLPQSHRPGCEVCAELPLQERYYREIFYHAAEVMFLIEVTADGIFRFLQTNRAFDILMKGAVGGLRGRNVLDVFGGQGNASANNLLEMLNRCVEAGTASEDESRMIFPTGRFMLHSSLTPMFDDRGRVEHILVISREISARKQAEQQISSMSYIIDQLHDAVYIIDSQNSIRYANQSACQNLGYSHDELLSMTVPDINPYLDSENAEDIAKTAQAQGFVCFETYHRAKDGHIFPVEISLSTVIYEDQAMKLSVVRDISERKRIEAERQSHLQFFESMDKVNRAIQGTSDLEVAMNDVLDEVLAIFGCDRAFFVHPCDPEAHSWSVPLERTRPEYPGAYASGLVIAMDEGISSSFRILLEDTGPVAYGPGNQHSLPEDMSAQFGFKSMMSLAIHPKGDKPWQFGVHQCSRVRTWTADEKKLFQEIGRRLADGLSSLLAYRTLQTSEREYRTLVENVPVNIARYDVQGCITYFNPPLEKLLNITTAEARGKRPSACFAHHYFDDYERKLLLVASSGEQLEFELQRPGDDGLDVARITMVAERDDDGNIAGVLAIGQSFTAQRRAEAALQRSEALYSSTVSAMIEGVIVQSQDGHILFINPAAEKILELSLGQGTGHCPLYAAEQVLTSDGKPFPEDQCPAILAFRTGRPQFDIEMGLCRADGGIVWILVNSQPLFADGEFKPYAVVSTFHNISEMKRAESERLKAIAILKENEGLLTERLKLEQRFSRMANHVPGFLYTFKMDAEGHGSFVYVSSGVKDIFGMQPEAVVGDMSILHNMAHPYDRQSLDAAISEAVRNATLFHYEFRICHPTKGILWTEAKAMPTRKDDGSIVFHGFVQDITERKRVESALKFVAQTGWQESRESFLVSLTGFLVQMLEVEYVLIDKLTADPTYVETVVVCHRGEILPNIEYSLVGTPCHNVMEGRLSCYPDQVQQQYPYDTLLKEWQVESYVGLPLLDSNGNALGLIAVMDGKPMPDSRKAVSILQLVAIRVAAELERDRFERALADSRLFLRRVIDTMAEPVFVKDRQHRWILVNAAFCKIIGHSQEVLLGKSDYDFFRPEEADEFWAKDEEVFNSGEENVNEEKFTDRHGVIHIIITKKTRYIDDNGEAVLVGIMLDITELKAYQREVEESRAHLRALASRSEKLREDERTHIARELHDDLGQRLTALKLDLSRLMLRFGQGNQELQQQVQEMELDMGATIQIVRDVASQLRPSALEMGIVSALEWLVLEFRKRTDIECRLWIPKRKMALNDSQGTALFRIVQESLTNIMRYAMASGVVIVLVCDGRHYVLEISDDGVGFDVNNRRKADSFGLIGIEERALSLGGNMLIDTAPGKGVKLTVRIPVSHPNEEALC